MLLAGVVMKLGAYGCLRVAVGLMPEGAYFWAPAIAWLAVINIVYGALVALNQRDFKYVIGYSSVSHMGFVLLGMAALNLNGMNGAVLQMFSHGVLGAALFALVGGVVYVRTKTRQLDSFHRLADRMPGVAWTFVIAGLASMGLPGFSGFVAELYVLIGVWESDRLGWGILLLAGFGILLAFGYVLVKMHEAFFRKNHALSKEEATTVYEPMTAAEKTACALLLGSSLLVGLYPEILTQWIEPSIIKNIQGVVK
jgi:NADH-quinone oxidoreductase subunit M